MRNVIIYTRSMCIWCFRAKRLLSSEGIPFEERDASPDEVRNWLVERTGRKTVPQIFFGDDAIGGFDDLRVLRESGLLAARLEVG